ncbi:MAG TPA: hypothetical protein VGG54_04290 [Trebonia sp.]
MRLRPPPPAACTPYFESFHTTSETRVFPVPRASLVPPTAVTNGDTAGYDSVVPGVLVPQVVEPESPAATNDDTPVSPIIARSALSVPAYAGTVVFSASAQPP